MNSIDKALKVYQGNVKALLMHYSEFSSADDRGFFSSVFRKMKPRLDAEGLKMPEQYLSDWYRGHKGAKRGLDYISAVKIGMGLGLSDDPSECAALIFLQLTGLWDINKVPPNEMLKRIKGDAENVTAIAEQLNRIEKTIKELNPCIPSPDGDGVTPLSPLGRWVRAEFNRWGYPVESKLDEIKNIFFENFPNSSEDVELCIRVLQGEIIPEENSSLWLPLAYVLNVVSNSHNYSPLSFRGQISTDEHERVEGSPQP